MAERAFPLWRATDGAALELHEPGLEPKEIVARLVGLVEDLGLARGVAFVEDGSRGARGTGELSIPLHLPPAAGSLPDHPAGAGSGNLRCRPSDTETAHQIEVLAAHAQIALDNIARMNDVARREDAVRRVAEQLQDSLLPELPSVPRSRLAVAYRAAAREARVGGDFYDVFPLPDGHVLTVVGDVVGKGVQAASRTTQITQTLRALALQGLPLDVLVERVDEQVSYQDPELMATLWCGLYEPSTGEMQFASLGHPPALLLRPEGEPIRLELSGLPLGMGDLSSDPPECRDRRLASGDLLVLYTDGVVESSGDFLAGQEALSEAVQGRWREPLDTVLEGVLEELLGGGGYRDDALMLLLRRV